MRAREITSMAIALGLVACARGGVAEAPSSASSPSRQAKGEVALGPPTIRATRIVPADPLLASKGALRGGGGRRVVEGIRMIEGEHGKVETASTRLASDPTSIAALPKRLGGGFLFVLRDRAGRGSLLVRSDTWLGPTRELRALPVITRVMMGLDRVYLSSLDGVLAIDPQTGEDLGLGPLPESPHIADLAAADGLRAVAIEDLRGVIVTVDGGTTWRTVEVPEPVSQAYASDRGLVVGEPRASRWFDVDADGRITRRAGPPDSVAATLETPSKSTTELVTPRFSRPFRPQPLALAITDGWPLDEDTAVVARDGALAKVRLSDGELLSIDERAFPLPAARCEPVPLARAGDERAFGFVCGVPDGPTVLYSYDRRTSTLVERKRFPEPRVVTASGTGGLTVQGGCETNVTHAYCVLDREGRWRELHLRADDEGARVVALANGDVAVVSPGDTKHRSARLTLLVQGKSTTRPIRFDDVSKEVAFALRYGVWLDGFEERRPGVLGGWIEAGGSMLGIEIDREGHATAGEFIRDTGLTFVSGRYGLGWSRSRESYETTDGGMTWQRLKLPEPLVAASDVAKRACGPLGCLAAGWIRVGWGEEPKVDVVPSSPRSGARAPEPRPLSLRCEFTEGPLPTTRLPAAEAAPRGPNSTRPLAPFFGHAAATIAVGDEAHSLKAGDLARIDAWGPTGTPWDLTGSWQIHWLSTFDGWSRASRTTITPPPESLAEVLNLGMRYGWSFRLVAASDTGRGLLEYRGTRSSVPDLFVLASDRAPVRVHGPDDNPIGAAKDAVWSGGAWFVRVPASTAASSEVIYRVEEGLAREVARVPRISGRVGAQNDTLVVHSNGRAIGVLVDTQAGRWILPIDTETGRAGRAGEVARFDRSTSLSMQACTEDFEGWVVVGAPRPRTAESSITIERPGATSADRLQPMTMQTRQGQDRECLERVLGRPGHADRWVPLASTQPPRAASHEPGDVTVALAIGKDRYALVCRPTNREGPHR